MIDQNFDPISDTFFAVDTISQFTKGFLDMIHLFFNPRKVNFSDNGWARGAVYKGTKIRDNPPVQ